MNDAVIVFLLILSNDKNKKRRQTSAKYIAIIYSIRFFEDDCLGIKWKLFYE